MGRTQPSIGQPPASFRRAARAKKAKATINQVVPGLLPTHPRARRGLDAAELIVNPPPRTSNQEPHALRLKLRSADTLKAARALVDADASVRVAVLNMASPLHPGGGFLNGASSQEESLCMRTTLLPSLKDEYYRLPELGAIYTPDVMVFRDADGGDVVLEKRNRWFVDCITAAMLRNPEVERDDEKGWGRYVNVKDRELAVSKMRMVMRICQDKGVEKIVLGAWGCGAYGNPVGEVAAAWRKVLLPQIVSKGKRVVETWKGIEECVFAIKDPGMADAFAAAFGDGLEREALGEANEDDEDDDEDDETAELEAKIAELRARLSSQYSSG
ncbi:hypothetical protein ACHAPB_000386 [Verticillium nonalfalfae]